MPFLNIQSLACNNFIIRTGTLLLTKNCFGIPILFKSYFDMNCIFYFRHNRTFPEIVQKLLNSRYTAEELFSIKFLSL